MKIAYVISTLEQCGPVNVLFDLVRNLPDTFEAKIFTLAKESNLSRKEDFEALGIDVECVVTDRAASMVIGSKKLKKALTAYNPDIVHAHGYRPYIFSMSLSYKKVATVHNCVYEDYVATYGKLQALWMTFTEIPALRKFDNVVACSKTNADCLRREYSLETIPIRNGIDQTLYAPLDASLRMNLRNELGYGKDATIVVSTGGCSERKNTLLLIRAFNSINDGGRAELHILGNGPSLKECEEAAGRGVYLHGFTTDVVKYLQSADLFVSASRSEGMPLAVLEALSCSLPVLLSDIPPHREIVEIVGSEIQADCFDHTNARSMSLALKNAMRKTRPSLIENSFDLTCFSATQMAKQYASVYQRVSSR